MLAALAGDQRRESAPVEEEDRLSARGHRLGVAGPAHAAPVQERHIAWQCLARGKALLDHGEGEAGRVGCALERRVAELHARVLVANTAARLVGV